MIDALIVLVTGLLEGAPMSIGANTATAPPSQTPGTKPTFLPNSPPAFGNLGINAGVFNGGPSVTIPNPGGVATNIPTGIGSNSSYVAIVQAQGQAGVGIPIYAAPSIQAAQTAQAYRAPQPIAPVPYGGFVFSPGSIPSSTPSSAPAQPPPVGPTQKILPPYVAPSNVGTPVYA